MKNNNYLNKLSIAPMMDRTDLHFRNMMRLISKNLVLYTEMIHANAILHDKNNRFNLEQECEGPTVLQIGCSDPKVASKLSKKIKDHNFKAININCGCPSDKVINGDFGAILMKKPKLVEEIVEALKEHVKIPITIKTRIGIDEYDNEEFLNNFINITHKANVNTYIIHARKAILRGLSPHENRTIPPLKYNRVTNIKKSYKHINFILNGGINNLNYAKELLNSFDGIMIGRYAWDNPWAFEKADHIIFGEKYIKNSRIELVEKYLQCSLKYIKIGHTQRKIVKPLFNILHSYNGSKYWKQQLNEVANNKKPINDILKTIEKLEKKCELAA